MVSFGKTECEGVEELQKISKGRSLSFHFLNWVLGIMSMDSSIRPYLSEKVVNLSQRCMSF